MVDRVGADRGVDLKPLVQSLESLLEACDAALGVRARRPRASVGRRRSVGGRRRAPSIDGEIGTREDAVRMLDLVCSYLERHEPSNPAPLFIRRAQRLMTEELRRDREGSHARQPLEPREAGRRELEKKK